MYMTKKEEKENYNQKHSKLRTLRNLHLDVKIAGPEKSKERFLIKWVVKIVTLRIKFFCDFIVTCRFYFITIVFVLLVSDTHSLIVFAKIASDR